ncbi:MAG: hypothetical protein Q9199_008122 [Rusavskia elegans]
MTFTDIFAELWSSLSLTEAHAESPPADDDSEDKGEEGGEDEEKSGDGEGEDGGNEGSDDDGGEEEGEEEEEEEEEPQDIKPKLEEGMFTTGVSRPHECISKSQWLLFGIPCFLEVATLMSFIELLPTPLHYLSSRSVSRFAEQLLKCAKSSQCAPLKHHYDACAERVTKQQEDEDYKGPKEDCVEESPKLFRALK